MVGQPALGLLEYTATSRSERGNGSGRRTTPRRSANPVALSPMPVASTSAALAAKAGERHNPRAASRRSWKASTSHSRRRRSRRPARGEGGERQTPAARDRKIVEGVPQPLPAAPLPPLRAVDGPALGGEALQSAEPPLGFAPGLRGGEPLAHQRLRLEREVGLELGGDVLLDRGLAADQAEEAAERGHGRRAGQCSAVRSTLPTAPT